MPTGITKLHVVQITLNSKTEFIKFAVKFFGEGALGTKWKMKMWFMGD